MEIKPIHIITINRTIHGANFFEKLILFKEIVGILLTIKNPIKNRLAKFKYEFWKIIKSNSKKINNGNKISPAAAGDGIPVKYKLLSIGLFVK